MRPDRIIIGEIRGAEAFEMLQAMNTGHDGSLCTVHANSPRDALARVENMVLMSGIELPVSAIREQMSAALHLIIQLQRFADGVRRIVRVTEVTGMESGTVTLQDLFVFRAEGIDDKGAIRGRYRPTGLRPTFSEILTLQGCELDPAIFLEGAAR
jgi:pilus assembly protein CpaF